MTANTTRKARSAVTVILALAAISCLLPVGQLAAADANTWRKIGEGIPVWRNGGALVYVSAEGKMLAFGGILDRWKVPRKDRAKRDVHYVQAFDPAAAKWSTYSEARPKGVCFPYYRAVCDPAGKKVYCLSQVDSRVQLPPNPPPEGLLFSFDLTAGTWKAHERDPLLKDMNWHTMALDPGKRRLVVVGSEQLPGGVGWSRTVVYDIASGKWSRLSPPDAKIAKEHKELVAATEMLIELIGRTRLAWYRDPKGIGTVAEISALQERCARLSKMSGMAGFKDDLSAYDKLISAKKTLDALKFARALQSRIEARAEAQYPVPPCRRNSPLVYDARNKCMVLFGGDHEDYQTNDTWILDLEKDAWRRARPKTAPGPRAGHALAYLPKSGRIAMYGGYVPLDSPSYGYGPRWAKLLPIQVWIYDVGEERWDLVTSWAPAKDGATRPAYHGFFFGQYAGNFSAALLASDAEDCVVLTTETATWGMKIAPTATDAAGTTKMATTPNQRLYRKGIFRAAYCEVPDPPPNTNLDKLPANRFVKLPPPPRDVCRQCRARPYSSVIWDPDRDQILLWGGGHCIRSENPPIHYSPVSGRMVEGYDQQESYSVNGAIGSTLMNRPWVPGHSYNKYAYDPKSKMMVASCAEVYVYDPSRMDWRRSGPVKRPRDKFRVHAFISTKHGAVALATARRGRPLGLWLLDLEKGWTELVKPGQIPRFTGGAYDGKRDRLILGYPGGWKKPGDGGLVAFHFEGRRIEKLTPANAELGGLVDASEATYVAHADWMIVGEPYVAGEGKDARKYVRAYDCAGNRWILLDIDGFPPGRLYNQGWMYDAKRKLVYVADANRWGVWALRLDPATVKILDKEPVRPMASDSRMEKTTMNRGGDA